MKPILLPFLAGHLETAATLIPPLREHLRRRRARRSPWEVHQGARPGLVVIAIPGFEKPPAVTLSARDVRRDVIGIEAATSLFGPRGWSVYGSPGKSIVGFTDGTTKTYGVQSADLIRELDEAMRRVEQQQAPDNTTVEVRIGDRQMDDLLRRATPSFPFPHKA